MLNNTNNEIFKRMIIEKRLNNKNKIIEKKTIGSEIDYHDEIKYRLLMITAGKSLFAPYFYIQNPEGYKGYLDSDLKNTIENHNILFTLKNYSFDDMKNDNEFYETEFKIIKNDNDEEILQTIETGLYYCPATKLLYNENKEAINIYKIIQESSPDEDKVILYNVEFSEKLTGSQNECKLILNKAK